MADRYDIEIAAAILDELTSRLNANIKSGGFNDEAVLWLIKAWTKVGMRLRGPSFFRQAAAYYVMKRDPSPSTGKRSRTLLSAMEAFETILERNGITEGDFFQRADRAMLDFVWEYRKQLSLRPDGGRSEQAFAAQLMKFSAMSADQLQKEVVANFERSL